MNPVKVCSLRNVLFLNSVTSLEAGGQIGRKTENMEVKKISNINMMNIRYFLPMVAGSIDGYYEVERIGFTMVDNQRALRLRLGRYIPIGENMVSIYRSRMQPGELISYGYTMKLYNGEV